MENYDCEYFVPVSSKLQSSSLSVVKHKKNLCTGNLCKLDLTSIGVVQSLCALTDLNSVKIKLCL